MRKSTLVDINAGIIDQRVRKIAEAHSSRLIERGVDDEDRRRSNAFTVLCVMTLLDVPESVALDALCDGGSDGGIDAIYVGDANQDEISIWLFQAKYARDLNGRKAYPAGELPKIIETIQTIFDPDRPLSHMEHIAARVEEIRSFIREGALPFVRVVLCNNGPRWGVDGDARIDQAGVRHEQVTWEHLNHDRLVQLVRRQVSIDETLSLEGEALFDDFNFRRVMVGRISAEVIADLMQRHSDLLLERNIRRYLGVRNRVNAQILETLRNPAERSSFYFYNNGVTAICNRFSYNKLQGGNFRVRVEGLQIINGGQTCKTIHHARTGGGQGGSPMDDAFLLFRLYQLDEADDAMISRITYATNHQSPIELRDLRANDEIQQQLELDLKELGYEYRRKRDDSGSEPNAISSTEAAEAVLAVWRKEPHRARFATRKLFDQYYERIFNKTLNGSQVVLAVLAMRLAENYQRQAPPPRPFFLEYATHYLAMFMGQLFIAMVGRGLAEVDHRSFAGLIAHWGVLADRLPGLSVPPIRAALKGYGVDGRNSLQRVAAQFRRADLLEPLLDQLPELVRRIKGEVDKP